MLREMSDKGLYCSNYGGLLHALFLSRVCHVAFDVAVFTNIGTDHLDFHGTLDNYVQAKAGFLKLLDANPSRPQKTEISGGSQP